MTTADDHAAELQLRRYYFGADVVGEPSGPWDGRLFDTWDPSGTRQADADIFTSDDFTALPFLSIAPELRTLKGLLIDQRDECAHLLALIPDDLDLAGADIEQLLSGPANRLYELVRRYAGGTTTTKLLARKRPRLFPIRDSVVERVMGVGDAWWAPLHDELNRPGADGRTLHARLVDLHETLRLPQEVSALRVLDVVAWMDGAHPLPQQGSNPRR